MGMVEVEKDNFLWERFVQMQVARDIAFIRWCSDQLILLKSKEKPTK